MYRVPVLTYLSLAGEVRLNEFKLKHQRVHDGHVLFETPREIERITQLLEAHNTGVPMPFSEVEYDGPALVEHLDILKGVRRMNEEWYSSQCPSCFAGGRDNKMNNLQFSRMGFRCMAGCAGRDVLAEFTKMLPVNVEVELERGQTTLPVDTERIVSVSEEKDETIDVAEIDGGFEVRITTKNKSTGKTTNKKQKIKKGALRSIWSWLVKNCPVGETVKSSQIREFLAEKHDVSIDAWASHTNRTIYFKTHYYPLKYLEWRRLITYHHGGSVTLLSADFENPKAAMKPKPVPIDHPEWRMVSAFILDPQDRFIMVDSGKGWMDVGGKREGDEGPFDTLQREVMEEVGVDISGMDVISMKYNERTYAYVYVIRSHGPLEFEVSGEINDAQLCTWGGIWGLDNTHFRLRAHSTVLKEALQ